MIIVFFVFFSAKLGGQEVRHINNYSHQYCFHCSVDQDWQVIRPERLKKDPFNRIFQLSFKRKNEVKHYGTCSFISQDLLITARHCVNDRNNLEYIELYSTSKNSWIKLYTNEYQIYYYTDEFRAFENDIALIRIRQKTKLTKLYKGHFNIFASTLQSIRSQSIINFSGFPCIKFAIRSTATDTLINRSTSFGEIELNSSANMIGYPLCMCSGDSGGPIWYIENGKYYLVGINQGSKSNEQGFKNTDLNIGVFINKVVKHWIDSVVSKK